MPGVHDLEPKYEDKIREYYVAWQKSLNDKVDKDVLKTEFENLRQKALLN